MPTAPALLTAASFLVLLAACGNGRHAPSDPLRRQPADAGAAHQHHPAPRHRRARAPVRHALGHPQLHLRLRSAHRQRRRGLDRDPVATSPSFSPRYQRFLVRGGHAYLAGGDGGAMRISLASGAVEPLVSAPLGGFALHGATAFFSDTNGDVRRLELAAPATSTVAYHQGLDYQNGELAVDDTGVTIRGTVNGGHVLFREPLAGGARQSLFTGPNEYFTGLAIDGRHAYVMAQHFNGSAHDGIGRVLLDGSSGGHMEWLTADGDHVAFNTQPGSGGPAPLTADSLIVSVMVAGGSKAILKRVNKTTGATCQLPGDGVAIAYVAGPQTFFWVGSDLALHWLLLP